MRALSLVCLSLAILGGFARAAHAKPTVAILGLEVVDNGGGVDEKSTKVAKDLTEALRARAKVGTGPYSLAPGSDKDLLEMKVLSGCDNEATACMASMGTELAADKLLYGKLEKQQGGYQITLRMLDVASKTNEKTTTDIIPTNEASGSDLQRWGKQLYNRLSGASDQGSLVVKANVDRGTVYVDKQVKGSLVGGTVRIAGLSEGSHEIAIEAEGKLRYEAKVSISGGEETTHNAELEANAIKVNPPPHGGDVGTGGGSGSGSTDSGHVTGELGGSLSREGTVSADEHPGRTSRALFWTGLVVTASSATGMTITGLQVRGPLREDKENAIKMWQTAHPGNDALSGNDACGPAAMLAAQGDQLAGAVSDKCDIGKRRALVTNVLVGTTVIAAAATIVFYYKGYVSSEHEHVASRKKQGPTVVFAPTIDPTQVGAAVRIDF